MKKRINISEVENFKPTESEYNTIEVSTHYVKGTGLVAYIQEGNYKNEGGVFASFSFDMFGSQKTRVLILAMTRKNQKKMDEAEKEFFETHTNQDLINILINNQK